jgi:hypothetical protein
MAMHHAFRFAGLLSLCLTCGTVVARAQSMDQDLMIKWSAFTVVRYVVVGEFSGGPSGAGFSPASATDRVELTFDWNQNETALVGTPTIKNFPGTMNAAPVANGVCPATAPRVTGTYDHLTLASARPVSNTLELKGTRSHPAAVVLRMNAKDECVNETVPASTEDVTMSLVVLPTVLFGMPGAAGEGVSISKDGKSLVAVDKENGWTWTYTPTGLK